jgi:hypothetical protein
LGSVDGAALYGWFFLSKFVKANNSKSFSLRLPDRAGGLHQQMQLKSCGKIKQYCKKQYRLSAMKQF